MRAGKRHEQRERKRLQTVNARFCGPVAANVAAQTLTPSAEIRILGQSIEIDIGAAQKDPDALFRFGPIGT